MSEINKKNNSPKSDDFAEAMKAIEKVRKADLKTEILRIDKKIATSRLHKDLRESVNDAANPVSYTHLTLPTKA